MFKYLSADCVFNKLIEENILESTDNSANIWKLENKQQIAPYYVSFYLEKNSKSYIEQFQVEIKDSQHLILKKKIEIILKSCDEKNKESFEKVLRDCVVK